MPGFQNTLKVNKASFKHNLNRQQIITESSVIVMTVFVNVNYILFPLLDNMTGFQNIVIPSLPYMTIRE